MGVIGLFTGLRHCVRLAGIGLVLVREGAFNAVSADGLPPMVQALLWLARLLARKEQRADGTGAPDAQTPLVRAIGRLGPSYVKLGQFMATRPDVIGFKLAKTLEALQDKMAPFSQQEAIATLEAAFGKPLDAVFTEFSEPLAAASIAQVHQAKIFVQDEDGEGSQENTTQEITVAVKIIRPGVRQKFARDLSDMYFVARLAERWFAEARRLRAVEVVDVLARSVMIEMDFRLEAAACAEFAQNCKNDLGFRVPVVDWDRTARDVLTLSWIAAIPLSDHARIDAAKVDQKELATNVIQSFLRHALRDGFFHADMHQGNLFVDDTGCLIAVDFGIMGRLGVKERRFLAEILLGFITRNYLRVAEVHFEAGYVPNYHRVEDFAQAIRAIGEPIYAQTADKISMAKLLTLLFEVTALFDMQTRLELVMLQKTMVVVEGVARGLNPQLDMWATAEPVVRDYLERELGLEGRLADGARQLKGVGEALLALPGLVRDARQVLDAEISAAHLAGEKSHHTKHYADTSLNSHNFRVFIQNETIRQSSSLFWIAFALWGIVFLIVSLIVFHGKV